MIDMRLMYLLHAMHGTGLAALLGSAACAAATKQNEPEGMMAIGFKPRLLALCATLVLPWVANSPASALAILEQVSPTPISFAFGTDFGLATPGVDGDVTALLQAVDLVLPPGPVPSTSNSGCEAADFAGFVVGNIALLQRGTCTFELKVANAAAAGAVAALIFNEGQPGRTDAMGVNCGLGCLIPTLFTSFDVGNDFATLLQTSPVTVHIAIVTDEIPEPATVSTLLLGLAAATWLRRGRNLRR